MKTADAFIDYEHSIAPWLGKTSKILDYYLLEAFRKVDLDLTKEQMVVLKKLDENDGLNQNELAFLTLRDKSSLARLLSKMEQKEYITRVQHQEDKRSKLVYITAQGRKTYAQTRPVIKKIMKLTEKGISKEEIQTMIHTLQKIQFNFTAETASL